MPVAAGGVRARRSLRLAGRPARVLPRAFYMADGLAAMRALLGRILVNETDEGLAAGRIVETEAYMGAADKAAHAYRGRTPRTEIQWRTGGHAYVYTIHTRDLFNVTLGPPDVPQVVLVRALEPLAGLDLMRRRRGPGRDDRALCSGPGKLCQALGITRAHYGHDLVAGRGLFIADDGFVADPAEIASGPRVGIDYAEEHRDLPWRVWLAGSPFVSRGRAPKGGRTPAAPDAAS